MAAKRKRDAIIKKKINKDEAQTKALEKEAIITASLTPPPPVVPKPFALKPGVPVDMQCTPQPDGSVSCAPCPPGGCNAQTDSTMDDEYDYFDNALY